MTCFRLIMKIYNKEPDTCDNNNADDIRCAS